MATLLVKQVRNLYQVTTNKGKYNATNIIIATGAKTTQLGLKEEKRFVGRGVSYCATCDGNFFKNQPVIEGAKEFVKKLSKMTKHTTASSTPKLTAPSLS